MIERVSHTVGRKLLQQQAKPHKYHAKAVVVDGIRFDSKREAQEYARLNMWANYGVITDFERQPWWDLHAPNGEVIGKYVADFVYRDELGKQRVVDVKGMRTLPLARWKQRHLRAEYGIVVEELR